MIRKTLGIRYVLFALMFLLIALGLVLHSYPLLIVCVIASVAMGFVGDKIENRPSDPYKPYNSIHPVHHSKEVGGKK